MEIPERFEDGLLFPRLSNCHSTPLRCHISQLQNLIHNAALGKRDSYTFIEVQNEVSLYRRSYEDASALLRRGCCVITASRCRTACWDSTIVCVKELQQRFLHGQRPRASRLWNCCSGLFIVMHALLFTINIQLSCPPTKYLIYGCERVCVCEDSFELIFTLLQVPKNVCQLNLSSFHPLLFIF